MWLSREGGREKKDGPSAPDGMPLGGETIPFSRRILLIPTLEELRRDLESSRAAIQVFFLFFIIVNI